MADLGSIGMSAPNTDEGAVTLSAGGAFPRSVLTIMLPVAYALVTADGLAAGVAANGPGSLASVLSGAVSSPATIVGVVG